MPAVSTQLLADEADLANMGPPANVIGSVSSAIKLAALRAGSGDVLAAYAKRYNVSPSQPLAAWGDYTKGLAIDRSVFRILRTRGFNPESKIDQTWQAAYTAAGEALDEIADITNKNARQDPDIVDATPGLDEMGPLACSEGGELDASDAWTSGSVAIVGAG